MPAQRHDFLASVSGSVAWSAPHRLPYLDVEESLSHPHISRQRGDFQNSQKDLAIRGHSCNKKSCSSPKRSKGAHGETLNHSLTFVVECGPSGLL